MRFGWPISSDKTAADRANAFPEDKAQLRVRRTFPIYPMMKVWFFLPRLLALSLLVTASTPAFGTETAGSIGRQLIGNTDLSFYEMQIRQPLPHSAKFGRRVTLSSAIEVSLGLIRETDVPHSELGRFAIIPVLIADLHPNLQLLAGVGAGLMGGNGDFTRHDLGGPFFFASKVGLRLPVTSSWGVELLYFHQSNGGIYDHNASLNMQMLGLYYSL